MLDFNGAVPQVSYTITDGFLSDTATLDITVDPINDAPAAADDTDNVDEDTTLTVPAITGVLSNDSDLDGDGVLVDVFSVAGIVGTYTAGDTAIIAGVGSLTLNPNGSYTFVPVLDFNGAVPQVTYTITDGFLSDTATLDITVDPINDAPSAGDDTDNLDEDTTLTVPALTGVLSNDSDLDGDGVLVDVFSVAGIVGTYTAGDTAVIAGVGSLTLNSNGSYTFVPVLDFNGAVPQVTYTITDGFLSDTATLDITVDPINDAPAAGDDTDTVDEDTTLTVPVLTGVLSNDSDLDGDGVTVSGFAVGGLVYLAGDTATLTEGDLTLNGDGSYEFVPALNFSGPVPQVTYTITDGFLSDTATLDITVDPVNDAPTASDDTNNVDENSTLTVPALTGVLSNDSDLDGDGVLVDSFSVTGILGTFTAGDTAVIAGVGSLTLNPNGSYSFIPVTDFHGAVPQVAYTVTDGFLTDTATLDITVDEVNNAPTAGDDTSTTDEDTTLTVPAITGVLSNDSDLDGDGITVSGFTVGGLVYVAGDTANLTEGDLTLNGDGSYEFVPALNFNGTVPLVTYTITDGFLTDTATLDITVDPINDAPTAGDDIDTTDEDTTLTVPAITGVLSNDSDLDGDGVTVSGFTVGGLVYLAGDTANLTEGDLTLNGDGSYEFAPALNFNGIVPQVTYTITDGFLMDTATLDITVDPINDAPTAGDDTGTTDEDATLTVPSITGVLSNDSDLDGDGITVSGFAVGGLVYVAGDTANLAEGDLTLNGDGSYEFVPATNFNGPVPQVTYTITDGALTDTATLDITVDPINDAPSANDDTDTTDEDTTLTVPAITGVLSNDSDLDGDGVTVSGFAVGGLVYVAGDTATLTEGELTLNGDGSYEFVPALNFNGTVPQVTYTITDGFLTDTATLDITVDPINDAPSASDDTGTTDEDTTLTVPAITGVLSNDSDLDGDGVTVSGFTVGGLVYVAGDTANLAEGDLTLNGDGSYEFIPATNFNGTVPQVTYTITDGFLTDTATLDITVDPINDAPTAAAAPVFMAEDTVANGSLSLFDADGDVPVTSLSRVPTHGVAIVNNDGSWTYTPNPDFNGSDQFEILVDDQNGGTTTVTIDVTIDPVADIADDQINTNEDTAVVVNAISGQGTVGGVGGAGTDRFEATPIVTAVTQGSNGSVTFSGNGDVSYTPDPDYNGSDTFTCTVLSGGVTETATVTVNVAAVNDDPTGVVTPRTTPEDTPVSDTITMADVDGDIPVAQPGTQPANGTVVVDQDGSWTYTPNDNYNGDDSFTVIVDDTQGGTAIVTVDVTVLPVNDAPDAFSKSVEAVSIRPTPLDLDLPSDVDDPADVLRSQIIQVPDGSQGLMSYVPDAGSSVETPLAAGLVLTNQELSTIVFTATKNYYGPVDPLIYQTSDDEGLSDAGSTATIDLTVVRGPDGGVSIAESPDDPVNDNSPSDLLDETISPIVVTAVNELESLGGTSRLDGDEGIVHDTIDDIVSIDATEAAAGVDPAVLKAVHAIDALKQVHLEDGRNALLARADWSVESLTGHSVKFGYQEETADTVTELAATGQLVIETYVRDRVLFIDVTNTFDPEIQGTVKEYRVTMANDEPLPDWIRVVRDGFVVAERPANLWDLNLKISAAMEDGSLITRGVAIDGPTGEIQPLEYTTAQADKDDGHMFEARVRQLGSG